MGVRGLSPVIVLAALAAACSEFGTSPDAFKAIEAGTDDAGTGDAGGSGDASGSGCTGSAHTFCDDFNDGDLGAKWAGFTTDMDFTLDFSTSALSPPRSLAVTFANLTDWHKGAWLEYQTPQPFSNATCRVHLFVAKHSTGGNGFPSALHITLVPATTQAAPLDIDVSFNEQNLQLDLQRTGAMEASNYGKTVDPGKWVELALTTDIGKRTARVDVDQAPVAQATFPAGDDTNAGFSLRLGLFNINGGTTGADVRYDDFSCDVK